MNDAPPLTDAERRPADWAVQNCHTLARREIRRLEAWRKEGGDTTPIGMAVTAWEHVIRICETTGLPQSSGILRAACLDSQGREGVAK
jgi:hypothetical protein